MRDITFWINTDQKSENYLDENAQMRMLTDFHILHWGMRGQGVQMAFGHPGDKSGLML